MKTPQDTETIKVSFRNYPARGSKASDVTTGYGDYIKYHLEIIPPGGPEQVMSPQDTETIKSII